MLNSSQTLDPVHQTCASAFLPSLPGQGIKYVLITLKPLKKFYLFSGAETKFPFLAFFEDGILHLTKILEYVL